MSGANKKPCDNKAEVEPSEERRRAAPKLAQIPSPPLNIVGIDAHGDVWSYATDDPFRADAVLRQMKKGYKGVVFIEQPENSGARS